MNTAGSGTEIRQRRRFGPLAAPQRGAV